MVRSISSGIIWQKSKNDPTNLRPQRLPFTHQNVWSARAEERLMICLQRKKPNTLTRERGATNMEERVKL